MQTIIIFAVAVVALGVGAMCGYFAARTRSVAAETLLTQKQAEAEQTKSELADCRTENTSLRADNARLEEQLRQQADAVLSAPLLVHQHRRRESIS